VALPVALDAMGGDAAPEAIVAGAIAAARHDGRRVLLCGHSDALEPLLAGVDVPSGSLTIEHWPDGVAMDAKPATAMRQSESSMAGIFRAVKEGRAGAAVSAGNSGATLGLALRYLGRIPGVQRPAISLMTPGAGGLRIFLDGGANTECTPQMLGQFGVMGSIYAEAVLGLETPRVGLLSNGSEEGKGTDLTRATFPLLAAADLHFDGYCEGTDIFGRDFDVVVTDGFTGNVALKTLEGTARFVGSELKTLIGKSWWRKAGALLARGAFRDLKVVLDPRIYGGAPLLGLNGVAIIAHGSSDALAVRSALRVGENCMNLELSGRVAAGITAFNALPEVSAAAG
jgi:phosphate acyltransferase